MENIIQNKESNDLDDAPSLKLNKIGYNCTECSSTIEIVSLNEKEIEFKCNNKHNKKMNLKEYLKEMKKYNDIKLNDKICKKHNEEYLSYCFECNKHLCKECLKTGEHSYHYKIILIEIVPNNELIINVKNIIKQNRLKSNI